MKTRLMSLVVCLTCLWCSYGSGGWAPGYLDEQVRKYCKVVMSKFLGKNSKNLSYTLDSPHFTNNWTCYARNKERAMEKYTVHISGVSIINAAARSDKEEAYSEALSIHTQSHLIPVGTVEYRSPPTFAPLFSARAKERHLWIMYVAITEIESQQAPYQIN